MIVGVPSYDSGGQEPGGAAEIAIEPLDARVIAAIEKELKATQ